MNIDLYNIRWIPFTEHPVRDYKKEKVMDLDISNCGNDFSGDLLKAETFSQQHYCYSLLRKLIHIPNYQLSTFLYYQCDQVIKPEEWLHDLEELLSKNQQLLEQLGYHKLINRLEQLIHEQIKLHQQRDWDQLMQSMKKAYKDRTDKNIDNKQIEDIDISKFDTELTIEQIACKYKMLCYLELINANHKTTIFKTIAHYYTSVKQDKISDISVKKFFNHPDPKVIDFWKEQFQKLIDEFNEDTKIRLR